MYNRNMGKSHVMKYLLEYNKLRIKLDMELNKAKKKVTELEATEANLGLTKYLGDGWFQTIVRSPKGKIFSSTRQHSMILDNCTLREAIDRATVQNLRIIGERATNSPFTQTEKLYTADYKSYEEGKKAGYNEGYEKGKKDQKLTTDDHVIYLNAKIKDVTDWLDSKGSPKEDEGGSFTLKHRLESLDKAENIYFDQLNKYFLDTTGTIKRPTPPEPRPTVKFGEDGYEYHNRLKEWGKKWLVDTGVRITPLDKCNSDRSYKFIFGEKTWDSFNKMIEEDFIKQYPLTPKDCFKKAMLATPYDESKRIPVTKENVGRKVYLGGGYFQSVSEIAGTVFNYILSHNEIFDGCSLEKAIEDCEIEEKAWKLNKEKKEASMHNRPKESYRWVNSPANGLTNGLPTRVDETEALMGVNIHKGTGFLTQINEERVNGRSTSIPSSKAYVPSFGDTGITMDEAKTLAEGKSLDGVKTESTFGNIPVIKLRNLSGAFKNFHLGLKEFRVPIQITIPYNGTTIVAMTEDIKFKYTKNLWGIPNMEGFEVENARIVR